MTARAVTADGGLVPLEDYDERYLLCRLYGDDWPDPSTWHWKRLVTASGRVVAFSHTMMCLRCNKIRTEEMDPDTGAINRTKPRYPEGYLRKGERLYRPRVRLEVMRRTLVLGRPGTVEDVVVEG